MRGTVCVALAALASLAPLAVVSCSSLQQDVNIEQVSYGEEVLEFERRLAEIDADSFVPPVDVNERLHREQRVDDFIEEIMAAAEDPSVQKSARARLLALAGKAQLAAGRRGKAKSLCAKSEAAYKGDAHAAALASRIEGLSSPDGAEERSGEVAEPQVLVLESALNFFAARRYAESVAKFDEAFLSLAPFYRDAYSKLRDMAWEMRSVDAGSPVADLLPLKEISVSQMLALARDKSDFLYNLTGGGNPRPRELFKRVSAAGLLNPASRPLDGENALGEGDRVSKYVAARFLWNLHAARNRSVMLRKYSSKFSRSPVQDLPADSPDFDAVLGCVENEFMSLDDGRSFFGDRSVTAIEFDGCVEKLR